jgi:hypothetical protein
VLEKYRRCVVVHVSPVSRGAEGYHGVLSGPIEVVEERLKKEDPHAEVLSREKTEVRMVIGGVLYSLKTIDYQNTFLVPVGGFRKIMYIPEAVEV